MPKELTFNLLYHVGPIGDSYRWNIEQILKRIHIFEGKKIVAVAQGYGFDDIEVVRALFPADVIILPFENDPIIRETKTFLPLLEHLGPAEHEATFYAHTKGITRGNSEAVKLWTTAMYHHNLDNVKAVRKMLEKFPILGCYKRVGYFPKFPPTSVAHYSGTFFWFRNKDLFEKYNWKNVKQTRYGVESYLGTLFEEEEFGCLFANNVVDPYSLAVQKQLLGLV